MKPTDQRRFNYLPALGEFRGEPARDVDPIWVFIHDERVRQGLSSGQLAELMTQGGQQSTICRGEKGGSVSLQITKSALHALGYQLYTEIRPLDAP